MSFDTEGRITSNFQWQKEASTLFQLTSVQADLFHKHKSRPLQATEKKNENAGLRCFCSEPETTVFFYIQSMYANLA